LPRFPPSCGLSLGKQAVDQHRESGRLCDAANGLHQRRGPFQCLFFFFLSLSNMGVNVFLPIFFSFFMSIQKPQPPHPPLQFWSKVRKGRWLPQALGFECHPPVPGSFPRVASSPPLPTGFFKVHGLCLSFFPLSPPFPFLALIWDMYVPLNSLCSRRFFLCPLGRARSSYGKSLRLFFP